MSNLISCHLRNFKDCRYHQISLLSPLYRSQELKKQRIGTVDMLYRAVDRLPRSYAAARLNPATAMVLPLQAAFYVPPSFSFVVPMRVKDMITVSKVDRFLFL
ncbi:hypothetical protein PS15m_006206 [Mucor circinelloides]